MQKGQDILLEAFAHVRMVCEEAVLWMVGDGPEEERLRELAGPGVVFLGRRGDVPSLLRQADLFALSSRWEGMPLVLLEAMSVGLPVVATAVDGVPEIVSHGITGLLVPPGDAKALAEMMLDCWRDPARARVLGANAAQVCSSRREQGLREYRNMYRRILC